MYPNAVQADSPVRYWRLEEVSVPTVIDEVVGASGDVLGGTNLNVSSASSNLGSAAQFNGTDGRIAMSPALNGLPCTIEAWGRTATTNWGTLYAESQASTGSNNTIQVSFGNGFAEGSIRSGTAWANVAGTTRVDDDQWHHIVVVFEPSGGNTVLTVYVDGQQDGAGTISSGFPSVLHNGAIGWLPRSNPVDILAGYADEVALYDYALSPARVAAHYDAAFATRWRRGDGTYLRSYLKAGDGSMVQLS